mmetsp:Transcript_1897/g.2447  ORF Transcript_1897/g.2447 Transcript_1897/m.2447 type:complete len:228 (-) Transcript_1897:342-1025(-)|eukprot:CAMPEP_0204837878 /NCGR_PEP_ID=MMETSP1346-20131115/29298_1 /ASSEMBLY_ACC=CAM_ASM_000771 /TAXON_ID=215587 /ORGANISM="Aplanochytrium stocchinoi, Strain GSBS06" /LENGTH=227 /DNA_ID=CAMNT_0051973603 /DNA_START=167 /DNA_END=850 /DNA_ORIENTATION=-
MGPTLEDQFVLAAKDNDPEKIKHYLSNGLVDVNCHNKHHMTALYYACHNHRKDMAELLLAEDDIDVNLTSKKKPSWTPLMTVCSNGDIDIVLLLLDHPDIQINVQNENGWTAFMYAAYKGHHEVVKRMCWRNDVDVLCKNKDGDDAMSLAKKEEKWKMVELLQAKHEKLPYETEVGKMLKKHNLETYAPILFEHGIVTLGTEVRSEDLEKWGIALDTARENIIYYIT